MTDKAEEFLDHFREAKSKGTYANCKEGLTEFLSCIGKSGNEGSEEHKTSCQDMLE